MIGWNLKNSKSEIFDNFNCFNSNLRWNWIKDVLISYSTLWSTVGLINRALLNKINLLSFESKRIEIKITLNLDFKLCTTHKQEVLKGNTIENNYTLRLDRYYDGLYILKLIYKSLQVSKKFL